MRRKSKRYETMGEHERSFIPKHDEGYAEIHKCWINGWMIEDVWAHPPQVLFNALRGNEIQAHASAATHSIDGKMLTAGSSTWAACEDEEVSESGVMAFYDLELIVRKYHFHEIPEQEDRELVLKHLPSDAKERLGLTHAETARPESSQSAENRWEEDAVEFAVDLWSKEPWIFGKHVVILFKRAFKCPNAVSYISRWISGVHPDEDKKSTKRISMEQQDKYDSNLFSLLKTYNHKGQHIRFKSLTDMKTLLYK